MLLLLVFLSLVEDKYTRVFKVDSDAVVLKITNAAGSITVKSWTRPEVKVSALVSEKSAEIKASQVEDEITISVATNKMCPVEFEVYAPKGCVLDLSCLQCSITIVGMNGKILAQNTDGPITITDSTSQNITAKSITGGINYSGTLAEQGIYHFHSVENLVEVVLNPQSTFTLMATATAGSIDLGSFQMSEVTSHGKWVAGRYGTGKASLNLSTHRGKIRLVKANK
ncbi:MAG: hypothetical protein RMM17_12250 [Acidobacteriota bacterium]|nr:hypothetical protein [Blastocatellia bacterium]MDW8413441.1 hypothetical protein [Acidobacteriota bacterium]